MKLFCVLISIFFINVSADDLMDFMEQVVITNKHIREAYNFNGLKGYGLEYVIKTIVFEDDYWIDQLNCMIAVPEIVDLGNIQEYTNYQLSMQREIKNRLQIPVPQVPDQDFRTINLTGLGKARRTLTSDALRNIIRLIFAENQQNVTSRLICRFIGLFTSIKYEKLFTSTDEVLPDGLCIISDGANHVLKYRSFDGIYWQVEVNDVDYKVCLLWTQL
ncbi:uncharacterized protein LOC126836212 isoform X2 [Adelges cooleyi]|uniref:uncharacterized protein LOC126836212 isoform X2 n=1 Tax=Adelges cooleyi TaxID=133065 RepID=UPI00217F5813|nr:uncharacterized protein LOC126836212 isoform X2 [Adelges cooleyi]